MKHIIFSHVTFALGLLITVLSSYAAMTTTTKSIFRTRLCAHSTSDIPFSTITSTRNSMKKSIGIGLSTLIVSSRAARAANVAESSLADSKKAAQTIRDALAKVGKWKKQVMIMRLLLNYWGINVSRSSLTMPSSLRRVPPSLPMTGLLWGQSRDTAWLLMPSL